MSRFRFVVTAAALGIAAPLLTMSPAAASPPPTFQDVSETFTDQFTDFCDTPGLTVDHIVTVNSRLKIQTRQNGLAYFQEHLDVHEVLTGVASGRSVTIHTQFISKDLKVVDNHDGTLTIISLLTGPSTLYGPDGKPLARDPGQVRFEILIDTNGTPGDPSDDIELSSELVKGSTGRSDDYCAAMVPVLS
jgi:hypothetical protein